MILIFVTLPSPNDNDGFSTLQRVCVYVHVHGIQTISCDSAGLLYRQGNGLSKHGTKQEKQVNGNRCFSGDVHSQLPKNN